jgi:serine/threonine protein kinase
MSPETVGPYRILEAIREGGLSSVYKAAGPDGAPVALKVFSLAVLENAAAGRADGGDGDDAAGDAGGSSAGGSRGGGTAGRGRAPGVAAAGTASSAAGSSPARRKAAATPETPELVDRFHREVRAVIPLSHPNILQVLGTGQDGDHVYLATELFDGGSLEGQIKHRRLDIPQSIAVMRGLCRGLAFAHSRGFVHGHLSPRHLLVTPTLSAVKIADFGPSELDVVAELNTTLRTGAYALGSFHYLAPEQLDKGAGPPGAPDPRSDIYAAGVLFFELLTGRPPTGKFTLPSQANAELPPSTDTLVLKCLARNPAERFASATALLAAIDQLEETLRGRLLSHLRGFSRLLGPAGSTRRALLLAAGALLLVALAFAGFLLVR